MGLWGQNKFYIHFDIPQASLFKETWISLVSEIYDMPAL